MLDNVFTFEIGADFIKKVFSIIIALILAVSMPLSAYATSFTGYTVSDTTAVVQTFEQNYSNKTIVLATWKSSDIGIQKTIRSKVDLTGLDSSKLVFYDYNKESKSITAIKEPNYSVDSESRVTFTTPANQGFVIITDSKLTVNKAPSVTVPAPAKSTAPSTPSSSTTTSSSYVKPNNTVVKEEVASTPIGQTVLVTRTGKKYHNRKCGNGTYYEDSLSSAEARGLTACSKCF